MWDFNIYLFKYVDSYLYKVLNISAVGRLKDQACSKYEYSFYLLYENSSHILVI